MERWKLGGGYLSLGSPQHVLLFLKDGIHTLKELHALLRNPAKKREQIDSSSLRIDMKHLENLFIYEKSEVKRTLYYGKQIHHLITRVFEV